LQPDEIIRKILEIRGIVTEEDVREFLSGKPQLSHDAMLMPGMKEGTEFLLRVLKDGKRICIYGDYDVDGVCGTSLLVLFLRAAARFLDSRSEIDYYIPSRIEEGYGLNRGAIQNIKDNGADVIVTVDCGSVSPSEAAYAREIGLDILITDHHDTDPDRLPDCVLINPKIVTEDGGYPFDKLAGAGVAFKLCSALIARMEADQSDALRDLRSYLNNMLDFVGTATIADVMPLVDENRTFVKYGGALLWKGTRLAFNVLLTSAGIDPAKLKVRDVAFSISPRINALGRLGDASEAVEFFLSDDENRIREIAGHMEKLNAERRKIQDECYRECMELIRSEQDEDGRGMKILLLKPSNSHEGVAGIVAGKIRDATGLPCAVLTETQDDKEILKGSVRSAGRLDVISLLRKHGDLFERFGGHAAAAGFTINYKNESILREALSAEISEMLSVEPDLLKDAKEAELEIDISDVTTALAEAIDGLAPFGVGNPKPALELRVPADKISGIRVIGQDGKHLRFAVGGIPFIFFGGAGTRFSDERTIRIVGCPEINEWNGQRNIQFAVIQVDVL